MVAKPPVVKKQPNVDQVTGDTIPKSFVFCRDKLPGSLKQLELDLRKLMLPYTALKLRENKRNNLQDFLNVAGPMSVTHFLVLSNPKSVPHLRVARTPQGRRLPFKFMSVRWQPMSLGRRLVQAAPKNSSNTLS